MIRPVFFLVPLLLAGCVTVPPGRDGPQGQPPAQSGPPRVIAPSDPPPPPPGGFRAPEVMRGSGLDAVINQPGAQLIRRFGQPRLDVREGDTRKLQFAGQACVLDVYLYPLRPDAEPVATYVDARRASDGQEVDRAACIAALGR